MRKKQLPAGTHDKLFRRAAGVYQLEVQVNQLLSKRGFQRIETPTIEFAEVFEDERNQDDLYRFFDNQGRMLTLRPDMTLPVGRVVASTKVELPLKLSYSGKVFRYHDEMKGLQNEFTQAGVEIIGFPSIKAEFEAILTAEFVLRSLHVPNFSIEIGHAGIFEKIVQELAFSTKEAEALKIHFLNKSISDCYQVATAHPSSVPAFLIALPKLFGEVGPTLAKAKDLLPKQHPILTDLAEIEALVALFPEAIQKKLRVDLGMVGVMDYYTGILFSSFSEGIPENFLSGGRYDYLFQRFDMEQTNSVGWAMNLEAVFDALYRHHEKPQGQKILVHFDSSVAEQATALVEPGVELSLFDTAEETRSFAKRWGYQEVWFLTDQQFVKEGINHD